ncbi:aspartyl protease family protein [Pelomonas sp. Root1217]|uniref:aspartyl protease family protein n=1 Tax=Pelomonas sp. Root1217 TaxID=1736430 RepID=UPI000AD993D5|nr:aspartyl protease family protein [Pelomonas sp. Root1217]
MTMFSSWRTWWMAAALLALPCASGAATAQEVLAAHRAATGQTAKSGSLALRYAYSGQGLAGTVTTRFDTASGAFVTDSELGPITVANGFDGRMPWIRDISGACTPQQGGDRVRLAINEAYRLANLWWRPDRGGARIEALGRETLDGRALEHLAVTPRGGLRFDAWFDAGSGLLARIAERQMFFDTRTSYDDYVRQGGAQVAGRVVIDGGTGESGLATMRLLDVSSSPRRPRTAYAMPADPPQGVTLADGASAATVPFRLLNNHIYVEANVNGHGPYTFIVDTGGHTILSSRVVAEAGLDAQGASPSAGAGEKTTTSGYAKVREIALGPVRMHDQTAITMDIYDPAVEGIKVDGMVGFELLRRLALRIDYQHNTLTFSRFDAFDAKDAGTAIPFMFYDHLPQVEGRVGDIPALFDIDTGSRSEVDLTSPFVAAHRLRERFPGAITAMTGWGVGGPSMSEVVRLPSLSIGPVNITAPVAALSGAKAGSFSDANFDGNIGSGLLKRFVTSFDYSRQRMYLKPIVPPPVDAGRFDRSGMWLNAADEGFVVAHVSPGGPAEAAGIAVGDRLLTLDARAVRADDLSATRALLRTRADGERIALGMRRGTEHRSVVLVLRERL